VERGRASAEKEGALHSIFSESINRAGEKKRGIAHWSSEGVMFWKSKMQKI
jgi:hypothetical protein